MIRSLEPLMPYQSKIPAGLLDSAGVQASTPEQQTLRFDRVEAVYGVAETLSIAAAALFAAMMYWRTSYGWVPPFWDLLAPSILISILTGPTPTFEAQIPPALSPAPPLP